MGEEILVDSPLPGRHQLRNIALAIASAEELAAFGFKLRAAQVEQGIRDVAQAIRQAARGVRLCQKFDDFRDCRLRLLLENTSGMGAAIGSRFEELKAIIDALPGLPVGICLDTAHAFHAGYGIHTEAGLAQTIGALERTVGSDVWLCCT